MKRQLSYVLFLALGAGTLVTAAVAQNTTSHGENAGVQFATFDPGQATGLLRQTDWDDQHRCDGDRDRDDRNCYYRDRDDRYRDNGYRAYGNSAPGYYQNGWYDRHGNYYPAGGNGYYDKHGRWHYLNGHGRDRDDR